MQFSDLDRDVQKKIISKMDIDARRALGVYTKLQIPVSLQKKISDAFKTCNVYNMHNSTAFYIMHITPYYHIERYVVKSKKILTVVKTPENLLKPVYLVSKRGNISKPRFTLQ